MTKCRSCGHVTNAPDEILKYLKSRATLAKTHEDEEELSAFVAERLKKA